MEATGLDTSGEARDALRYAVENFGPRVLSNPQMLSNVFQDLLPDRKRVLGPDHTTSGMRSRSVCQRPCNPLAR